MRIMESMKSLDYIGTGLCMVAYLMLTNGMVFLGLHIGTVGSACLIVVANRAGLRGMTGLQFFFICANIFALVRIYSGA